MRENPMAKIAVDWMDRRAPPHEHKATSTLVSLTPLLALAEVKFLQDDSNSMTWNGGGNIKDAIKILSRAAELAKCFDTDGLELYFLNRPGEYKILNGNDAAARLRKSRSETTYDKGTPLGSALYYKILKPIIDKANSREGLDKIYMIYVVTDGYSNDQNPLIWWLKKAHRELEATPYGAHCVSIMFTRVGDSPEGEQTLEEVDEAAADDGSDNGVGSMCDAIDSIKQMKKRWKTLELRTMSQSEWEWKFLLGGLFSAADADKIHGDWSDILLREVLNGKFDVNVPWEHLQRYTPEAIDKFLTHMVTTQMWADWDAEGHKKGVEVLQVLNVRKHDLLESPLPPAYSAGMARIKGGSGPSYALGKGQRRHRQRRSVYEPVARTLVGYA